jgi:hypothetical protein
METPRKYPPITLADLAMPVDTFDLARRSNRCDRCGGWQGECANPDTGEWWGNCYQAQPIRTEGDGHG